MKRVQQDTLRIEDLFVPEELDTEDAPKPSKRDDLEELNFEDDLPWRYLDEEDE